MNFRVRRWLRSIALVLGMMVVVFALFHDAFYRWVALRALHRFAGIDSSIEGTFDVSHGSPLVLDLSGLQLALAGRELEGPRGSIGSVHFEIRLLPLLSGRVQVRDLVIRDAEIELFTLTPSHILGSEGDLPVPLLERWTLENLRVGFRLTESGARNELLVTRLTNMTGPGRKRTMRGSGSLDGDAWALKGELGSLEELLTPTRPFPISLAIEVPDWGLNVDARGTVGVPLQGKDLQLDLKARTDDLTPMLGRLLPGTPFAGALAATARLTGSLQAPLLTDLDVDLQDGERIHLDLHGNAPLSLDGDGLDLTASLTTRTAAVARYLTGERVPDLESLQMAFKARRDGGIYLLEEIAATVGAGQGREAAYEGSFRVARHEDSWRVSDIAGKLAADVATESLKAWLPDDYPLKGRVKAAATLAGDETRLSVPSFQIEISGDGPLQGTVQGKAELMLANLPTSRPTADVPVPADLLSALSTRLDLKTADVRSLGKAIGVSLPALGSSQAKATIQLQKGRYRVADLDARTSAGGGLKVRTRGSLSLAALSREGPKLSDVKLQVDLSGPNLAAAKPLGARFPVDPGPWTVQVQVHSEKGRLKVDRYILKAGEDGPNRLELDGNGGELHGWLAWDIAKMKQASMKGRLRLGSIRTLGSALGLKVLDLGRVDASFEARSEASGWAIPEMVASIEGKQGITLKVSGSAEGIPASTKFRADLELEATGKAAASALTDGVLTTARGLKSKGKLHGAGEKATYKGTLAIGSTTMDADLALDMSGARPLLTGSLSTSSVNGADLGWPLKLDSFRLDAISPNAGDGGTSMLSTRPLDFPILALTDFELDITADAVQAYGARISSVKLTARNRNRLLQLDFKASDVASGQLSGVLDIDASRKPPKLAITSRSNFLSLEELHGWLGATDDRMSGRLSFELQLEGSGRTLKEAMANANGAHRQVILDGHLVGGDLDLLDMQALHLLLSMAAPSNRTDVECMIAEFDISAGIASAKKLFVQTPKMRVAGTGTLNFRDETVDLLLRARRRRFTLLSQENTIEVKGPMAALEVDTNINAITTGTAVTAGIVVAPVLAPVAGLGLLNDLLGDQGENACKEMGARIR